MEAYEILWWVKVISFAVLLLGLIPYLFLILSTRLSDGMWNFKRIISGMFFRVPFQVEIMKLGKVRWLSHFLIFLSFLWFFLFYWFSVPFRMSFFLHDLFAVLFGIGLAFAFLRRMKKGAVSEWEDYYSLFLLLLIWMSGLLTEVSKVQHIHPEFRGGFWLGSILASAFLKIHLTLPFTFLLILHILSVGLFIVSIPFTKLFHILFLPLKEMFGEV